MSGSNCSSPELPPGFRFHPTDEELIMHYLRNQVLSRPCPASIIPDLNIYKFDPWELPEKSLFGEGEWYFFSPRDRKYPNGARPNRATRSGYWKATGTDKAIHSSSQYVGVKKALVFYKGRPPKGRKTGWIMHEYRLGISVAGTAKPKKGSMRLDDWVLCRIYQKKSPKRAVDDDDDNDQISPEDYLRDLQAMTPEESALGGGWEWDHSGSDLLGAVEEEVLVVEDPLPQPLKFPRSCSLAHLLDEAEYMSVSQMLSEYTSGPSDDDFHAIASSFDADVIDPVAFPADSEHDRLLLSCPTTTRSMANPAASVAASGFKFNPSCSFLDHTIF